MVDIHTGTLDTKKEFQRWRRDINHIHHLLLYARKIFQNIDPNQPVNQEAAKLLVLAVTACVYTVHLYVCLHACSCTCLYYTNVYICVVEDELAAYA